jgi:hypothetical protein
MFSNHLNNKFNFFQLLPNDMQPIVSSYGSETDLAMFARVCKNFHTQAIADPDFLAILQGYKILNNLAGISSLTRQTLNNIRGFYALGKNYITGTAAEDLISIEQALINETLELETHGVHIRGKKLSPLNPTRNITLLISKNGILALKNNWINHSFLNIPHNQLREILSDKVMAILREALSAVVTQGKSLEGVSEAFLELIVSNPDVSTYNSIKQLTQMLTKEHLDNDTNNFNSPRRLAP